jgi:hypothetical protein
MRDELQHAVSKSFHLSSSSLNGVVGAGTAARLIYHNRDGIAACQENLSLGVRSSTMLHEDSRSAVESLVFLRVSSCDFVDDSGASIAVRVRDCPLVL